MTTTELGAAQSKVRYAYRSASIGQLYAGVVWLASAAAWSMFDSTAGILVLFIGGFFIYPVTSVASRLLGNPGVIRAENPLREAGVTIPIVGALGLPVAGAAALYDVDWFYPAVMVIMGAHYLPFSHLYGMRIFLPLGTAMWLVGVVIGLWAPHLSAVGAWLTGTGLVGVGIWAARRYQLEFGDR